MWLRAAHNDAYATYRPTSALLDRESLVCSRHLIYSYVPHAPKVHIFPVAALPPRSSLPSTQASQGQGV